MKFSGCVKYEDSFIRNLRKLSKTKIIFFIIFPLVICGIISLDNPDWLFFILVCSFIYLVMIISHKWNHHKLKKEYETSWDNYEANIDEIGITEIPNENITTIIKWEYFTAYELRSNIVDLYKDEKFTLSIAEYMLHNQGDWYKFVALVKEKVHEKKNLLTRA